MLKIFSWLKCAVILFKSCLVLYIFIGHLIRHPSNTPAPTLTNDVKGDQSNGV